MGVRWLVCNVRKGTRWLYRGYTWQRLVQSSVQSFEGAPCRALRELRAELCAELRAELWWSSVQSFGGAPCRALRELRAELHQRLYQKLCQKFCTKLCQKLYRKLYQSLYTKLCQRLSTKPPQSSTRSSTKALHGAPSKPCTEFHQSFA